MNTGQIKIEKSSDKVDYLAYTGDYGQVILIEKLLSQ